MFIFIEAVLGTMVLFLAFLMLREKNVDKSYQISVIVENADDTQWSAFKYGLKMAAEGKDKVKELDINPVFITEDGAAIADALLVLYDD